MGTKTVFAGRAMSASRTASCETGEGSCRYALMANIQMPALSIGSLRQVALARVLDGAGGCGC